MQGLRPLQRYFDFSGRSGRAEYWQWIAISTAAGWITGILDALSSTPYDPSHKVRALLAFSTLVPSVAVGVRRLHDRNRSGWLYGIMLGLIAVSMLFLLAGKYVQEQSGNGALLGVGVLLLAVWAIYTIYVIVQLAKAGDAGLNRYGAPDDYKAKPLSETFGTFIPASTPAAPPTSFDDQIAKIERLGRLRDQGLLSQDEFDTQKKRILANDQDDNAAGTV